MRVGSETISLLGVMMKLGIRLRLVAAVVPLFLVVATVSIAGASGVQVAIAAGVAGVIALLAILELTIPFERLRLSTAEALRQAPTLAGNPAPDLMHEDCSQDGTGEIAQTIWVLLDRLGKTHMQLAERDLQFKDTLSHAHASLAAIAENSKKPLPALALASPWPDRNRQLNESIDSVNRKMAYAHSRVNTFNAILNELPDGVLVCDDKGHLVFLNTAAARMLPSARADSKTSIMQCFTTPPRSVVIDPDAPKLITPMQLLEWIGHNRGDICYATANDDQGSPVAIHRCKTPPNFVLKGYRVLQIRDIAFEMRESDAARQRHRRDVGHRLCLMMNNETLHSLVAVRTQAALLAQASKQSGQRDRFVPKVERLLEELSRQEIVITLLGWLGRMNKSEGTSQDAEEVRLRDVIDNVANKVQPMFRERTNSLEVNGDAGWMVADESWLTVLATGLLMHANHVLENKTIHLDVRRRTGGIGQKEQSELVVRYVGKPISGELVTDVQEPFGRINSAALASSGPGGFPLGLTVASRIAKLMGGDLTFGHSDGEVFLRTTLPTCESHVPTSRVATTFGSHDEPEFESTDALGGWEMGGKIDSTSEESGNLNPEVSERLVSVPFDPDVDSMLVEDTVGDWFGNNAK